MVSRDDIFGALPVWYNNFTNKVLGLLSAMGSAYIIYQMVVNVRNAEHRRKKLDHTFDRLLLGLCVSDFVLSLAFFFGSWAIPAKPPAYYEDVLSQEEWNRMFPQSIGNALTCNVQGSLFFYGMLASVLFTGSLAVSFLLQVKFKFQKRQMRIAEYFFFGVSIAYPLICSTLFLILGANGYGSLLPDINGRGCILLLEGPLNWLFRVPLVFIAILNISCMAILFWSVRTQELRSARWSANAAAGRNQRRCFVKMMLYLGAYLIVWVPIFLSFFTTSKTLRFIQEFFVPLQGFLNALVYSDFFRITSVARKKVTPAIVRAITRLSQSLPNTPNSGNATGDDNEHQETNNSTPSSSSIGTITILPPSLTADSKGALPHIDEENQCSDATTSDSST